MEAAGRAVLADGGEADDRVGALLEFDAHLSQLMSEPLGVLELIAPATLLNQLES